MALTVETGSVVAGADAFVSVADADDYAAAHGLTAWTAVASSPSTAKDGAIRRATTHLNTFGYKGAKIGGRDQLLAWPRSGATDREGDAVASDEVPFEIVSACIELAALELTTPGILSPTVTMTDRVKREKVGSLEVEYAGASNTADAARPVVTKALDLIGGLLAGGNNPLVGTAVRG